jgi:recombination protein RecR
MAFTPSMQRLVDSLARLPGIGEKTAARLAFFILRTERSYAQTLSEAILGVKDGTRLCTKCFGFTETDPCGICDDPQRATGVVCVVEEPADLIAIERAGQFRGRYHVLHGTIAPLDGIGPDQLKVRPLVEALRNGGVQEIVVATNPTAQGEATALYLAKLIKPLGVRVSRIAHGIPMGGDVEYADVVTLGKAIEGRREM